MKIDKLLQAKLDKQEKETLKDFNKVMKKRLSFWVQKRKEGVKIIGVQTMYMPFGVAVLDEPFHNIHYFFFDRGQEDFFYEFTKQKKFSNNWTCFPVSVLDEENLKLFEEFVFGWSCQTKNDNPLINRFNKIKDELHDCVARGVYSSEDMQKRFEEFEECYKKMKSLLKESPKE